MVTHPAAIDLPHALVEWVAMLIVTREGDRRCKPGLAIPAPSEAAHATSAVRRPVTSAADPASVLRARNRILMRCPGQP